MLRFAKVHQTRSRKRPSGPRPNSFSVFCDERSSDLKAGFYIPWVRRGPRHLRTRSRRIPHLIRDVAGEDRSS